MNNGAVGWTPSTSAFKSTASGALDVDWEPDRTVAVSSVQINFDSAPTTAEAVVVKILDANGRTVFNFGSFTPSYESGETEFSMVCENHEAPVIPKDGKVTIDFPNTDNVGPIEAIIATRNVYGGVLADV